MQNEFIMQLEVFHHPEMPVRLPGGKRVRLSLYCGYDNTLHEMLDH